MSFLDRDRVHEEVGSDAYVAGLLMERTAGIQPAKLHAALLDRATRAGAQVHHRTRVTRVERTDDDFRVQTTRGSITAGDVLLAANAYVDGALPSLRRRVLPIGSFVIATEPLAPELQHAVLPGRRMCFDTKHLLNYWRLSPDGRMVFGGRASLSRTSVAEARDVLYAQMLRIHPQLRDVPVTHRGEATSRSRSTGSRTADASTASRTRPGATAPASRCRSGSARERRRG